MNPSRNLSPKDCSMTRAAVFVALLVLLGGAFMVPLVIGTRAQQTVWTKDEKVIVDQINHLRSLADDVRARTTRQLALDVRALPPTINKIQLATALGNLSTEGDFGHDALQEVATTLAGALREQPLPMNGDQPAFPYIELATLARYEHVEVSLDNPQYAAAVARLAADDEARQHAGFTLTDLQGKSWSLQELRGNVVLVNFWATWCQPCRKEMPDLDALYKRFKGQGFVVLGISDEEAAKVNQLLSERNVTYPILLDPGRKVNEAFRIEGIPKSFVYDRKGKLVAQAVDMRTQKQFIELLAQAGLH